MASWFPEGEARKHKDGCEWCGLMGCDCPPEGPQGKVAPRPMVPVCGKCKRAKGADGCHCKSQFRYSEKHEAKGDVKPPQPRCRPYTQRELKELVHEGMAFYYHNDPAGLARWLQEQLQ